MRTIRDQLTLRVAVAALTSTAVLAISPSVAFGAKTTHNGGGPKSSGTSSLYLYDLTTGTDHATFATYGDTVTFDVATDQTQYPTVDLLCYQNGTLVYSATAGFYQSYPWPSTRNMILTSTDWSGGAASCTATLNGSTVLATLDFPVNS